ncbi:MAG: hypothetical protein WCJ02_09630 [bacterium]
MTLEQNSSIDFLLVTQTKGMFFNPHRPEGLEFITSSKAMRFTLRPTDQEGNACGNQKGLVCKLFGTYPTTKEQSDFVDSHINHGLMLRVADDITLPFMSKAAILIDKNGKYKDGFHPRRCLFPSDIRQLIGDIESELVSKTNHFLKLLRWRQGIDAPCEVIEHRALYWKIGGGNYLLVPLEGAMQHTFVLPEMLGIHWDDEDSKNLQELWAKDDIAEPLGHTLVREASALASESPRSAILIMTAALETAVKMHISSIAPDTDWLMEETPSPPIFKILRDYIPLIHLRRDNELVFWEKVKPFIKKVQKLIELRNKVAHTGKIPEDAGSIHDNLELVSDLLYLLDVLAGHDWAKSLTSQEFRNALDWPSPTHGRIIVTITDGYQS